MLGSFRLSAGEVIGSLLHLTDNPSVDFVIVGLRLPTATTAVAVGLALGASGTIFQQLLRNPLASLDFVGISAGAGLAAVSGIVLLHVGGLAISALALGGAIVAAVRMYVLTWRDGVSGYRFIIIGIGLAAFFEGGVGYALTRAQLFETRQAMHWLTGSVGQASSSELRLLLYSLLVLLPTAVGLSRAGLLATAVTLVALAVAVAGPIAFVALVAGPIAHRLLGPAVGGVMAAALVGAALLLAAKVLGLLPQTPLAAPADVVTAELVEKIFGLACVVIPDPVAGTPMVVPS